MINAGGHSRPPDDNMRDPKGNAGTRIACGVKIKLLTSVPIC